MDYYGFYTGKEFQAYEYLGAHVAEEGVVFRTFAPNAEQISLIGEFNGWQEWPMNQVYDGNFWECYVENAAPGMMYKYKIYKRGGGVTDHCDPYGFRMELRPNSASIIYDLHQYKFEDKKWMKERDDHKQKPLNIYELHMGSWKKKSEEQEGWYSYEEVAKLLIPYLKENGYNYVEVMPLSEHPCDESWGYQNTGFFAPTARYGTPDGLRRFVELCHEERIGVIMDFVPVHFALDAYALGNYDGTALYEYPHQDVGKSEWGSCNFMHSRGEVRSFLQSSAYYWLQEFHFDGLRMDAISNLIYWQGNEGRGENRGAIQFLQYMNQELKERIPSAMLIAEDSTAYPGVTRSVREGGLGFDYKWDLGWMHDTLSYFQSDPSERTEKYHKLTFSMQYYYNERYLLPFSHDEVVHGKATILQRMNGDYEGKFPQARAMYMYMYAHPGKKLNFMGNELGQLREWDEKREQDWLLLDYPIHDAFHTFMQDLQKLYQEYPALWELDYEREGFQWLDCHCEAKCIYAFERRSKDGQRVLAVFHFSDREQDYELPVSNAKSLKLLLDSDRDIYGGQRTGKYQDETIKDGAVKLTLKPFSARYYLVEALGEYS